MQVVLEEAMESYKHEIVVSLDSNTAQDMESNLARIVQWYTNWPEQDNQCTSEDSEESEEDVGLVDGEGSVDGEESEDSEE
jgi:adenylate kinase